MKRLPSAVQRSLPPRRPLTCSPIQVLCETHTGCGRSWCYFIFQFKATIMGLQSYTNDSYKKIKDRDTQSEMHGVGELVGWGSWERPPEGPLPGSPAREPLRCQEGVEHQSQGQGWG